MKKFFARLSRLRQREGDRVRNDPPRRSRPPGPKSPRGTDNLPVITLIICALLLTLQQAQALDMRNAAAVGDQIAFRPSKAVAPASAVVIPARVVASAWAPPARSCRLNMRLITRHWGAFTVLAVRADGVMLSWAGGATAKGSNDCLPAHKLLVSGRGYVELLASRRADMRVTLR